MSTLSSVNVTDVNLVLKERTHMRLCLNMLIFTHNLGNWLIVDVVAVTCRRLVSQLINTSMTHWHTVVNVTCHVTSTSRVTSVVRDVTCDVSRTFADKRQETSVVSVCDDNGHWSPDVPDCIGKRILLLSLYTTA